MRKSKRSRAREPKTRGARKKAHVKFKMHGISIEIPAELDLPAGAPFEGRELPATMKFPKEIQELFGPLVDMATNAWRLKRRMVDPESGEPKEETRKLYRFVEGLFRALGDAGIQVIDKTGKRYDNGMSEEVVSFDQVPGLLKDEIIDTVRPSIRWKEQSIYRGEIIVGIPVIETASGELPKDERDAILRKTDSALKSGPQDLTVKTNSGPDQTEGKIPGNPSCRETEEKEEVGGTGEQEFAPAGSEETQEQECLVCPKTPAQPATPAQAKER